MKCWRVIHLLLLFSSALFAQEKKGSTYKAPSYVGGRASFFQFLDTYIHYPNEPLSWGFDGELRATILIAKNGEVKAVGIWGGNRYFAEEIRRTLLLMPAWNAAKYGNREVDTIIKQKFIFFPHGDQLVKDSTIYLLCHYWEPYTKEQLWEIKKQESKKERTRRKYQMKVWKPLYEKGLEKAKEGKFEEAAALYEKSWRRGNNTASLYYDLSVAYENLGQLPKSCECLREAALRRHETAYNRYLKNCK